MGTARFQSFTEYNRVTVMILANRIFRLVYSHALNASVPVAEIARGRGKYSARKRVAKALSVPLLFSLVSAAQAQTVAVGSSASWKESTVTTSGGSDGTWTNPTLALPGSNTFTNAVTVGTSVASPAATALGVTGIYSGAGVTYYSTTFNLASFSSVTASLNFAVDNNMAIWINGSYVADAAQFVTAEWLSPLPSFSIAASGAIQNTNKIDQTAGSFNGFKTGTNTVVLAVRNTDGGDSGGFAFLMNVNEYNHAAGSATSTPVSLTNQRVGGSTKQALTVSNTAASGGYSEALNASIGGTTGAATTNGGSISLLAAGSNSSAISVGVSTATAGAKSGTVSLGFVSDGTGTSGAGQSTLTGQTINVSGNVYQIAQSTMASTVGLGNAHVGASLTGNLAVTNTFNNATTGWQEGLNASVKSVTGAASGSGTLTNLAAGSTGNLSVSLSTTTAGAKSGTVTLTLASNGSTTSTLGTLALADSSAVAVTGGVYNYAAGSATPTPVILGNQRVGGDRKSTRLNSSH